MDLKPPLGNVISDSTHPNVTPDPRWPSKCRSSIESPPPAISTGTVSTAEKSNAGSELSSPPAVNVDNEVMRHQIDVMVLESNPVVSSETPYLKQLGESDSVADPELVAAGDNTSSEITSQPENEEVRNTCVQDLSSPQSPGLPPITYTSTEISVVSNSYFCSFARSLGQTSRFYTTCNSSNTSNSKWFRSK
uniref:Uncharacterized protein n=1 Tax=Brassica oleracea TaxID=3712 RepID=A0A3P6DJQ3_BRAOL|nr:unnamed protein product [Brassica oleracea]